MPKDRNIFSSNVPIFECVVLCILAYPPIKRNAQLAAFHIFFIGYSVNLLRQAQVKFVGAIHESPDGTTFVFGIRPGVSIN